MIANVFCQKIMERFTEAAILGTAVRIYNKEES